MLFHACVGSLDSFPVAELGQVGGYDIAKKEYGALGVSGVPLHISSALTAGFVYSAAT